MIGTTAGRTVGSLLSGLTAWLRSLESEALRLPPLSFVAVVLLFAGAIRVAAAVGPLWLDEIWSLELASQPATAAGVLTELRADNNHILNTLYLRALGPGHAPLAYRLPAVLTGLLSVFLAGRIAARWGRIESLLAMTLFATSYLLVHYASEARGYSFAIGCALLAWDSVWSHAESRGWPSVVLFWGSAILGLLAHPIFLHMLLALLGWYVAIASPRADVRLQPVASWRDGVALFGLPIVFSAVMYWTQWRSLDLGGGPEYSLGQVLARTASLAIGGPATGWGIFGGAALFLVVYGVALWQLRNEERGAGMLLGLLLLVPLAQTLAMRPPFLFPRYFLMTALATPFAAAVVLANLPRIARLGPKWNPGWSAGGSAALLVLWIGGHFLPTAELIRIGRGNDQAVFQFLADRTTAEHAADSQVTLSSDHNFGVRKLLDYYRPQLDTQLPFQYIPGDQWPAAGPRWVLFHREAEDIRPAPAETLVMKGHTYRRAQHFEATILSGWQWWCYRREP